MPPKTHKRHLGIIFLVVVTELIGFGLIIPILPQLADQFGVNRFWIGILMASYSAAQFIAAPILGSLSDRFGRKPILIISKLGTCLAYVLLAVSQTYILFLVARLIDGFTGGNIATARAYVSDITPPEDRPKGMAIIGISFGLGFILGPALGGVLYGVGNGHFVAAIVAGSLSLLALLLTIFLLEEPDRYHQDNRPPLSTSLATIFNTRMLLVFFALQLAYMVMFSGFETTFSVFTFDKLHFDAQANSWLFAYAGLLGLCVQGFISRKPSQQTGRFISIGFIFSGVGFYLFSATTTLALLLLSLSIFSVGIGLVNVYLPSLLSVLCDSRTKGQVMGIYESIGSLGRILGPGIAYLAIFSELSELYLTYAIILLCIGVISMIFFSSYQSHDTTNA